MDQRSPLQGKRAAGKNGREVKTREVGIWDPLYFRSECQLWGEVGHGTGRAWGRESQRSFMVRYWLLYQGGRNYSKLSISMKDTIQDSY
jgi:hypothetical protein